MAVYFTNRGISDLEIITLATTPPKIILTENKDFGDLVFRENIKGLFVIFLRYPYYETTVIIERIIKFLKYHQEYVIDHFTTITINKFAQEKYSLYYSHQ